MFNPIAQIKIKDLGELRFELYRDVFDSTGNFIELANKGYYDGLYFFNHIPDLFIQSGCLNNDGTSKIDYTIRGEFATNGFINKHNHQFGSIGMVRSIERNSAGAQFYISLTENSKLDDNYAVFGDLISGGEILNEINISPEKKWEIERITINDRGDEVPIAIKIER